MQRTVAPVKVGDRIIVAGWNNIDAWVSEVTYIHTEARWKITLHWDEMGVSHVYDSDEGEIWFKHSNVN